MRKGKYPDPDPDLWLMNPDPGGQKTCGSGSPTLHDFLLIPIKYKSSFPFIESSWTAVVCCVQVEMYGLPCDTVRRGKFRTRTVPNGLNPLFNEENNSRHLRLPPTYLKTVSRDWFFLRRPFQFCFFLCVCWFYLWPPEKRPRTYKK